MRLGLESLQALHDFERYHVIFERMAEGVAIAYSPRFREFSVPYRPRTGGGFQLMTYCPWSGQKLPVSLRQEWFRQLGERGLNLTFFSGRREGVPTEYLSDAWWRHSELARD